MSPENVKQVQHIVDKQVPMKADVIRGTNSLYLDAMNSPKVENRTPNTSIPITDYHSKAAITITYIITPKPKPETRVENRLPMFW